MSRQAVTCVFAALAVLGAAAPQDLPEKEECPQGGSDVVVSALRFSEGPPSYSFMVTNNGTRPIGILKLGRGEGTFIEAQFETVPTSVGSPRGWEGMHVFGQDPRLPEAHSHSLVSYLWNTEDPEARIQPGHSLTGFSVQFPAPKRNSPGETRTLSALPDLTNVPFRVWPYGARCPVVGVVEPDGVGVRASGAVPPQIPGDSVPRDADGESQDR